MATAFIIFIVGEEEGRRGGWGEEEEGVGEWEWESSGGE